MGRSATKCVPKVGCKMFVSQNCLDILVEIRSIFHVTSSQYIIFVDWT